MKHLDSDSASSGNAAKEIDPAHAAVASKERQPRFNADCPLCVNGDAESFVRTFIERLSARDIPHLKAYLAPEFTFIAALEDRYRLDRGRSMRVVRTLSTVLPPSTVVSFEVKTICASGGLRIVMGSFVTLADPMLGEAYSARQRLTAIVRPAGGSFEVIHLHLSNPLSRSADGLWLPMGITNDSVRCVRLLAANYADNKSVVVTEVKGRSHVLRTFDVVWLEANRQYTAVHCLGKTVRVRKGIGAVSALFPSDRFVEVRRGSVVNILHVVSWDEHSVRLAGGVEIPLPARRSVAIRDELARARFAAVLETEHPATLLGRSGLMASQE